jgi:hypothetical protein
LEESNGENKAQMSFCYNHRFRSNRLSSALVGLCVRNLCVVERRSFGVCDLFVIACILSNKIFFDDLRAKYYRTGISFPYGFKQKGLLIC